jgi:hypothetical protein
MRPVETVPGMGGGGWENDEEVNWAMVYCKNFCACCKVPPVQQ